MSRPSTRTPNGMAHGSSKITSFFQKRTEPLKHAVIQNIVDEQHKGEMQTGKAQQEEDTSKPHEIPDKAAQDNVVSDDSLSSIDTPSPHAGSPIALAEDSQQDIDAFDPDSSSDEDIPSLETLYPSTSLRRSSRPRKSSPPISRKPTPSKPASRQRSPDLSLAWLAKQREHLEERAAARARTEAMLNESIEEFKYDDGQGDGDGWGESVDNALGKESSEKLKAALNRIGGDLNADAGYRFFRHVRKERKFDEAWIKSVDWLKGVDDEQTRTEYVRYGFVKDMLNLGEDMPSEMIIWMLEHIAFEQSQSVALAFSEVIVTSLMKSAKFVTAEVLDQIVLQHGVDEDLLKDDSLIEVTKSNIDVECNKYGLLLLAVIFGSLASCLHSDVRAHVIMILMKMSMDAEYGPDLTETVEASLVPLLQSLSAQETTTLLNALHHSFQDSSLQIHLLDRLPIYPSTVAQFRQSLAKQFLDLPPMCPIDDLLTYLRTSYPFKELPRDISNTQTQHIKAAMLIFDIAISLPPREEADVTRKIIKELQYIHRSIIDGRAAFIVRTEAKEIMHRVWLRLDYAVNPNRGFREEAMVTSFYNPI